LGELSDLAVTLEHAIVINTGELHQLQLVEHLNNVFWIVYSMGVEAHTWPSNRQREQELSCGYDNSLKLSYRTSGTERVERIPVAPEADVLGNVQT
jgi:hypothetical protein